MEKTLCRGMHCILCQKEIQKYDIRFHHLKINDGVEVDICSGCIDIFEKWRRETLARLFPTRMVKDINLRREKKG